MMLATMPIERFELEPEAKHRHSTGSHLNDGLQPERRPRRFYLFCNGDQHFKGKVVLVNPRQYRTFEDFLGDVTNRMPPSLPLANGVRRVFTPIRGTRLRSLSELEDGQSYVCAGFETFKPMPYGDLTASMTHSTTMGRKRTKSIQENPKPDSTRSSSLELNLRLARQPASPARTYVTRQRIVQGHDVTPAPPGSKVRPRIITIFRNGSKPLQNVKILFNRKSVQTYAQFLDDVAHAFESSSRSNRMRKLVSIGGKVVGGVSDLFRDDEFFIVIGAERIDMDTVRDVLRQVYPNSDDIDTLLRLWTQRVASDDDGGGDGGVSDKSVASKMGWDVGRPGPDAKQSDQAKLRRRGGPKIPRRFMERMSEETARLNNFSVLPPIQSDGRGRVTGNGAQTEVQAEIRRAELSRFNRGTRSTATRNPEVFHADQGRVRGQQSGDVSRPKVSLGLPKERKGRKVTNDGTGRGHNPERPSKDSTTPEVVHRAGTALDHLDLPAAMTRESRIVTLNPPPSRNGGVRAEHQPEFHEDSVNNNWSKEDNQPDHRRTLDEHESPREQANTQPKVLDSEAEGPNESPNVSKTSEEVNRKPVARHERYVPSYRFIEEMYELGRILGDGNFAVVKQCTERATGKEFAMKVVDKVKLRGKESLIENEILIMKACNHPNIVKLFLEYETNNEIFLLMELVGGGDLFDFITRYAPFNEVEAAGMVYDLAKALSYLHSRSVVHRDVKPENIVVQHGDGDHFSLKLADFGLATEVRGPLFTVCGTPTYVAPEILLEIGYGLEIDTWAVGVILYILLCGFAPFRGEDPDQLDLFEAIKAGEFEFPSPYWDNASNDVRDLITHLLQVDVRKRHTAVDVICHPFIVTCAGTFNPPNIEQLRINLRNELKRDALVHRNSFAAVLAQLK